MYDDPFDPFATTTNLTPPRDPGGNGWWQLVGGVWRWMTEPLPRPTTDPVY
jgi:hypothetical protein